MNEAYEAELDRLHEELAHLYRNKSTDAVRIEGLWARIERTMTEGARQAVREARNG